MESGTKLSHYEISTLLGKGGMGEVWRAKDTKLGREVAIKTLPEEFAKDADRLGRFEREAKLLASLNHPNIAAIHGFEEDNGTHFLVLELVEGDTLAEKLKHGAIPVEESLKLAVQIAEALEAAHEKGVIHRDLKPANIKVTDDGKVKVLDFGLAKAFEGDAPDAGVSNSPTLSMAATQQGTILGTAAYMSPEQARGKTVDKRADVWAFGVVLYESLTGKQAFADDDVSMTLSRVLQREPDFDALPTSLSPTVNTYIRRCIEKDPKQRVRDVGDVRLALEGAFDAATSKASDDGGTPAMDQAAGWGYATSLALASLAVGSLITGLLVWNLSRPDPQVPIRFTINTDPVYTSTVYQDIAISPDGQRIAYLTGGDEVELNVRTLDQFAPVVTLGGDSCCHNPFFSPDGQWVGFVDLLGAELRRIRVDGGPTVTISDLEGRAMIGATWGDDDTIIFSTAEGSGLWQVPAAGGDPEPLTTTDAAQGELNHLWPEILPGGEAVLFSITSLTQDPQIAVLSLGTGQTKIIMPGGSSPRYAASGHLVYAVENSLRAVGFDLDRLEVRVDPFPILEDVLTKASGAANFAISDNGSLVYMLASTAGEGTMGWVDRNGAMTSVIDTGPFWAGPRLSPDGTRVAVAMSGGTTSEDIWIYDLDRDGGELRLISEGADRWPVWTPDGSEITFTSTKGGGTLDLYSISADFDDAPEPLLESPDILIPDSWSEDGQVLVYVRLNAQTGYEIWSLAGGESQAVVVGESNNTAPQLSPDGRSLAFASDRFGEGRIFLQRFPGGGGVIPVSTGAGTQAVWSRDGRELFYRNGNQMMVVGVETEPALSVGQPRVLFEAPYDISPIGVANPNYDVSPDGQQFLMIQTTGTGQTAAMTFVLNWFEELKERVPVP